MHVLAWRCLWAVVADKCWWQGLYDTTLALLEQALRLWPGTHVRMHYVDKLLSANKAQQLNPPPALLTGLHVMSLVLSIQVAPCPAQPGVCTQPCSCRPCRYSHGSHRVDDLDKQ